jgi:hypothetical protein
MTQKQKTAPTLIIILTICIISSIYDPIATGNISTTASIQTNGVIVPSSITYFSATFDHEGPEGYKINQAWPITEPCKYNNERGTWHWVNCGTGNGDLKLITDPANASRLCLQMLFSTAGTRPLSDNQHIKLYNIQSRETALWNGPYLTTKSAYYQMYYWFPEDFNIARYSWRLIWQLNGEYGVYGNTTYAPQMGLIFGDSSLQYQASGYYYNDGKERDFTVISNSNIPKGQWVKIVVYVEQGSAFKAEDGTVVIWINDNKVLEKHNLSTATVSGTPYEIWGIGNYGGPNEAYGQYILVKDVKVTSQYPL